MSESIEKEFKGENRFLYYIPSKVVNRKKMCARGSLYDCYTHKRKQMIKCGLVNKRKALNSPGIFCFPYMIHRKLHYHVISDAVNKGKHNKIKDIENEDILWLQNNIEPWPVVVEKWGATFSMRRNFDLPINVLLGEFPALKTTKGHILVC